jgi:hypothetical protein
VRVHHNHAPRAHRNRRKQHAFIERPIRHAETDHPSAILIGNKFAALQRHAARDIETAFGRKTIALERMIGIGGQAAFEQRQVRILLNLLKTQKLRGGMIQLSYQTRQTAQTQKKGQPERVETQH